MALSVPWLLSLVVATLLDEGGAAPAPTSPPAATPTSEATNATPTSGTPTSETFLVLDLDHSASVSADDARTLTDLIVGEVSSQVAHRVLSGADLRNLTALEGEKQAMGCDADTSCLAELATAMGARYLVSGRLSTLGSEVILQASLFDASKAEPIARQNTRAKDLTALADRVPEIVAALLAPLGVATTTTTTAPPAAEPDEEGRSFLSLATIGAGGAVAAVGAVGVLAGGGLAIYAFTFVANTSLPAVERGDARNAFYVFSLLGAGATLVTLVGAAAATGGFFIE